MLRASQSRARGSHAALAAEGQMHTARLMVRDQLPVAEPALLQCGWPRCQLWFASRVPQYCGETGAHGEEHQAPTTMIGWRAQKQSFRHAEPLADPEHDNSTLPH